VKGINRRSPIVFGVALRRRLLSVVLSLDVAPERTQ